MGHNRAPPVASGVGGKEAKGESSTAPGRSFIQGLIGSGMSNTDLTKQTPDQATPQKLTVLGSHQWVATKHGVKRVKRAR